MRKNLLMFLKVAAVSDAERGKNGALNAFLQQRHSLRTTKEENDRLRAEVSYKPYHDAAYKMFASIDCHS